MQAARQEGIAQGEDDDAWQKLETRQAKHEET